MLFTKLKIVTAALALLAVAFGGAYGIILGPPTAFASARAEEKREAAPKKAGGSREAPNETAGVGSKPEGEDRMLRWKITFSAKDGKDYAKQLEALGATLAIPTSEQNRYRMVCDLSKRPVKSTVEDLPQIKQTHRFFWVEDNATSLKALSEELGLSQSPQSIVVFLPKFIQDELLRKELAYSHRAEQDIEETTFQFFFSKRGFDVKVASQTARPSKSE